MKAQRQQILVQDPSAVPEGYRIEEYGGTWYASYLDPWENWQPFRRITDDSVIGFPSWSKTLKRIQRHISSGAAAERIGREEYYKYIGLLPTLPHEFCKWLNSLRLHELYPTAGAITLHDRVIAIDCRVGTYYKRALEPHAQYETPGLPLPLETIQREIAVAVEHFGAKRVLNETFDEVKQQRHAYYVEIMKHPSEMSTTRYGKHQCCLLSRAFRGRSSVEAFSFTVLMSDMNMRESLE